MKKIWAFIKDEDGLELSEYAVMGALIIIGLIAAITALGGQIEIVFEKLKSAMIPAA